MEYKKDHINPERLIKSSAFSQVVTTQGPGKTIYIGGQNSSNQNQEIIGQNDIEVQTDQVMRNLEIALNASGAGFDNLVKLNIHLVQGVDIRKGFEVSRKYLRNNTNQPVITVIIVAGLVNPHFLIEIDAIAFVSKV